MRICFIDASVGTFAGGSESIIYNLGLELSKRHEVAVITGRSCGLEILPHIRNAPFRVITLPFISRAEKRCEKIRSLFHLPLAYDVEAISLFLGFLRSREARACVKECDVVSFHYAMTSLLFSQYLKMKNIPSVFHAPGSSVKKWFFKRDRSTLYLANSLSTEKKIFELTGRHADGIVTPGINFSDMRSDKSYGKSNPVILSVARLTRSKGVYRLLEIFKNVRHEIFGAKLLLVGQNFERDSVNKKVIELGLEGGVRFTGQISYDELGKYYSDADLLVHASFAESFGMVLAEAMSYGLPVVAADTDSMREASWGKGLLLPFDNSEEWSEATVRLWAKEIVFLLRDPVRMKKLSEEGRRAVIDQTWDKKAAEYERYLLKACDMAKERTVA